MLSIANKRKMYCFVCFLQKYAIAAKDKVEFVAAKHALCWSRPMVFFFY